MTANSYSWTVQYTHVASEKANYYRFLEALARDAHMLFDLSVAYPENQELYLVGRNVNYQLDGHMMMLEPAKYHCGSDDIATLSDAERAYFKEARYDYVQ